MRTADTIFKREIIVVVVRCDRAHKWNLLILPLPYICLFLMLRCDTNAEQEMKAMLYNTIEQAPSAEVVDADILARYYATFDEQFFHYCDKELAKINTFYSGEFAVRANS